MTGGHEVMSECVFLIWCQAMLKSEHTTALWSLEPQSATASWFCDAFLSFPGGM